MTSSFRSRWAAFGAATAVTLGAAGLASVNADSAESAFVSIAPARVLDTRIPVGLPGPLVNGAAQTLDVTGAIPVVAPGDTPGAATVVPDDATAIVANVTAVDNTTNGFVSVRPGDATGDPTTSSINLTAAGQIAPNSITVGLASNGTINLFFFGTAPGATTHLLVDVVGYYIGIDPPPASADGRLTPDQVGRLAWDEDPARAVAAPLPNGGERMAFDGSAIWVTSQSSNSISKINTSDGTVLDEVDVGAPTGGIAFDGTHIWVTRPLDGTIIKLNPDTHDFTSITLGSQPSLVLAARGDIWVSDFVDETVSRLSSATGAVIETTAVPSAHGLAYDGTHIWVTNIMDSSVSYLKRNRNEVGGTVATGGTPDQIAFDGSAIWVTNFGSASVTRINPVSKAVDDSIVVPANPSGIAYDGRYVWVATSAPKVARIDPQTNSFELTEDVGAGQRSVVFDGSSIWVAGLDRLNRLRQN